MSVLVSAMPAITRLLTTSGVARRRIAAASLRYRSTSLARSNIEERLAASWRANGRGGILAEPPSPRSFTMLVGSQPRRVAIVGGLRIPFARAHGAYARVGNQDMLTAVLRGLVERFGLKGLALGEVAAGAVMKHSSQWNLVRECVLSSGLAPETPGLDLQRACGTSLEAAILVANKIALGQIDSGIAGGVDTVSDAPIVYPREYQQLLLTSFRGRSLGAKLRPWLGLRPRHFKPSLPGVVEPRTGLSMGESCEQMARQWEISREAQDALALESHRAAGAAYDAGFYRDLVMPFEGVAEDNNLRRDTSLERLAKLRPGFRGRWDADGRQQHAHDRWRLRGAARQ
jgi:acetyl-CoA C-acetyltransferase